MDEKHGVYDIVPFNIYYNVLQSDAKCIDCVGNYFFLICKGAKRFLDMVIYIKVDVIFLAVGQTHFG